jgi:hypothetical protein
MLFHSFLSSPTVAEVFLWLGIGLVLIGSFQLQAEDSD